jgi:hypothetical protein
MNEWDELPEEYVPEREMKYPKRTQAAIKQRKINDKKARENYPPWKRQLRAYKAGKA